MALRPSIGKFENLAIVCRNCVPKHPENSQHQTQCRSIRCKSTVHGIRMRTARNVLLFIEHSNRRLERKRRCEPPGFPGASGSSAVRWWTRMELVQSERGSQCKETATLWAIPMHGRLPISFIPKPKQLRSTRRNEHRPGVECKRSKSKQHACHVSSTVKRLHRPHKPEFRGAAGFPKQFQGHSMVPISSNQLPRMQILQQESIHKDFAKIKSCNYTVCIRGKCGERACHNTPRNWRQL